AAAVSPRTRAVVFNSPNNPSGKVFSRAELQAIADLCLRHDLLAITDEIYEHIVFDGLGHTPIATLPGMADRTVTISGISKSYSVTGWRVGYAVANPELSVGIRRAHDFITVGAPHPPRDPPRRGPGLLRRGPRRGRRPSPRPARARRGCTARSRKAHRRGSRESLRRHGRGRRGGARRPGERRGGGRQGRLSSRDTPGPAPRGGAPGPRRARRRGGARDPGAGA